MQMIWAEYEIGWEGEKLDIERVFLTALTQLQERKEYTNTNNSGQIVNWLCKQIKVFQIKYIISLMKLKKAREIKL